jgi:hypothetical protein
MCSMTLRIPILSFMASLCLACGGSHKHPSNPVTAGTSVAAGAAGVSGTSGALGTAAGVVCGGVVCTVPAMAFGIDVANSGLEVEACCAGEACGIHVVGSAAVRDICLASAAPPPQATTGCPSYFDKPLNVYKWGCCLADGYCGQIWNGAERLGCADPRLTNGGPTGPCQSGVECKVMHASCTSDDDCCQIPPTGSSCVDFGDGSGSVCAPKCEMNSDCGTVCCQSAQNGVSACAPEKICLSGG